MLLLWTYKELLQMLAVRFWGAKNLSVLKYGVYDKISHFMYFIPTDSCLPQSRMASDILQEVQTLSLETENSR